MNDIEREGIILNSAWGMIDDLVNWAMFVKNDATTPTNLMFQTNRHARLFVILLGDFLSEVRAFKGEPIPLGLKPVPHGTRPANLTFLFHIRQVCDSPKLGAHIGPLRTATDAFADWLEGDFVAQGVNLGNIDIVADLRISRLRYLRMCGDIAKHNLARLSTNVAHLRNLLENSGHRVSEQDAYLAIENFFDWFQDDIFLYHSSRIAEFLNNIRWAIFEYLGPEFRRSWHLTEKATPSFPHYAYDVPREISEPIARAMYWDLMNRVRAKPWVSRFTVHESFYKRY